MKIPKQRVSIIQAIVDRLDARTYLEVGVRKGETFLYVRASRKIAVDPCLSIPAWSKFGVLLQDPANIFNKYCEMTSDVFFRTNCSLLGQKGIDVAFVDGLHTFEQSLRDVQNCLKYLNPRGVVFLHDCNPTSETMATPTASFDHFTNQNLPGAGNLWSGDVWKTVVWLRSQTDLSVFVLDCDYGIGVICRGKPDGTLKYDEETINELTYRDLERRRTELLNLRPPIYAREFLNQLKPL